MKKIIALLLALLLVLTMAVPAAAVTPPLRVPELPEIPDISDNIRIDTELAVDKWFDEHPIRIDWTKFDFSRWFR